MMVQPELPGLDLPTNCPVYACTMSMEEHWQDGLQESPNPGEVDGYYHFDDDSRCGWFVEDPQLRADWDELDRLTTPDAP